MKKSSLLIILGIVAVIIIIFIFVGLNKNTDEKKGENGVSTEIKSATEITLNQKTDINTLKNIKISGTNDYFSITDDLKDTIPYSDETTTVSSSIAIPYKFIVDGTEFQGTYILGDYSDEYSLEDENPKYDLEIKGLKDQGIVTVLINEK